MCNSCSAAAVASQNAKIELFYSAAWQPAEAYTRDVITLDRGLADESLEPRPGNALITLQNRDGSKNPNNPTSPLYGLVGRNTPVRVSVDGDVRLSCEAADWAPGRTIEPVEDTLTPGGLVPSHGDAWAKVTGAGILRRLGRGDKPLNSPAFRALTAAANDATRVAYWPLEDESGTILATSPVGSPLGVPGYFGAPGFGGYTASPSAERMASMQGHTLFFTIPQYASSQHKVIGLYFIPASTSSNLDMMRINCTSSVLFVRWFSGGGLDLQAWTLDGSSMIDSTGTIAFGASEKEFLIAVELTQNGANVDTAVRVYSMDDQGQSNADTLLGVTIGRIESIQIAAGNGACGQLAVGNATNAFANYIDGAGGYRGCQGYNGEPAGTRFLRLCSEEGVPAALFGTASDTQPMGPQPVDTLLNILSECARTDAGIWYEARTVHELRMKTGRDLCNQGVTLVLDYTQISPPLDPIIGDQGTRNDVTATRRRGGSTRAVLATGRMSTQAPPNGVGRYDTKLDVNCATDARLVHHANWHLHRWTVDETRYREVTIDLTDQTSTFITAVNAVNIGNVITIDGLPNEDSYDIAHLMVIATREVIGDSTRRITFTCLPASPYEVAVSGAQSGSVDLRGQAVDTDASTLAASVAAAPVGISMTISVATAAGNPLWTTDSNNWDTTKHGTSLLGAGLFIRVGGEDMRVTNITGAASPQTFTVLRGQNGVVKAHSSGAPVHVRFPAVAGL